MNPKLENLELRSFFKIYSDYKFLRRAFEESKRFQHDILFVEEQDALVELNERILENSESYINLFDTLKMTFESLQMPSDIDYDTNYKKLIPKYPQLVTLNDHMKNYWFEFRIIIKACIKLDIEFLKLRRKFGDIAFKSTFADDWA